MRRLSEMVTSGDEVRGALRVFERLAVSCLVFQFPTTNRSTNANADLAYGAKVRGGKSETRIDKG